MEVERSINARSPRAGSLSNLPLIRQPLIQLAGRSDREDGLQLSEIKLRVDAVALGGGLAESGGVFALYSTLMRSSRDQFDG
jgi:hypothetical protein